MKNRKSDTITTVVHFRSLGPNGEKVAVVERVVAGSDTYKFLKRLEETRLAKEYDRSIDLRDRVSGEIKRVPYKNLVHYLDQVSYRIFQEGVRSNGGKLTVQTAEKILSGKHLRKRNTVPPPSRVRKADRSPVPGFTSATSPPPAAPAPTRQTPGQTDEIPKESQPLSPAEQSPGRPETVTFGYFHKRSEPRLVFVSKVELRCNETVFAATTKDLSLHGTRIIVEGENLPFRQDEIVEVTFQQLQEEHGDGDADLSGIPYSICSLEENGSQTQLRLRRQPDDGHTSLTAFLETFMQKNRKKYKLDPEDEQATATSVLYQKFYCESLTQLPLFIRLDDRGSPYIQRLALTRNNENLFEFFRSEKGVLDLSPLRLPQRIHHIVHHIAPASLHYDVDDHSTPFGEMILICFRDQHDRLYSAADFELETVRNKYRFIMHAMVHQQFRVYKIMAQLIRDHDLEKLLHRSAPLAEKSPEHAERLHSDIRGMLCIGMLTDITAEVRRTIEQTSAFISGGAVDINGLRCWQGERCLELPLADGRQTGQTTLLPMPKVIRFAPPIRRREERYLARTKVTVEINRQRFEGITRDFSLRGMCIELHNAPAPRAGQSVAVGLINFGKKKQYAFDINRIPYTVKHVVHEDPILIMLEREHDDFWRETTDFFAEIIDINKKKLNLCIEDVLTETESRLHQDVLAAHLVTIPMFFSRDDQRRLALQRIAIAEYSADVVDFFATHGGEPDFTILNDATLLETLFSKLNEQKTQRRMKPSAGLPCAEEVYFFRQPAGPGHSGTLHAAIGSEFPTIAEKTAFLQQALESKRYRFYRLIVSGIRKLENHELENELETLSGLSGLLANQLKAEIKAIQGYGELLDITRDVVEIINVAGSRSLNAEEPEHA